MSSLRFSVLSMLLWSASALATANPSIVLTETRIASSVVRSGLDAAFSDEIFANGFDPVGYAIPLASPDGADSLYTVEVGIGNQTFSLLIDTGSTSVGVAGAICASGCSGISPEYVPSSSASNTGFNASTQYADGSGWSGSVYNDILGLGEGSPAVSINLVDISMANTFFDANNAYQGILGLGSPELAEAHTTAYIATEVTAGIDNTFAFDLCDNTGADAGTMWLGGDGGTTSAQYTPMLPISNNNPFYAINVDALSLGSTVVISNASQTFAQPVIDTGTSLFYVPTSVYHAFVSALQASASFKTLFGNNTFSQECVTGSNVTDSEVESELPPIVLSLPSMSNGSPDFTIQASALNTYLYNAGSGQYCLAIQDGGTSDPSTFGDAFMQAFHIVIDVAGSRMGFGAPTTCVAPALQRIHHPAHNGPHRPPRWPRP